MPNSCCVCGIKMGKMQQYYQLSKNHPEEHLCPECAQEIQNIYDLANSADPEFRRHMRRFSGKLEAGTSSGAAIGYLEHFFQNCNRLYRDQLMKASAGTAGQAEPVSEEESAEEALWVVDPESVPNAAGEREEILEAPAAEEPQDQPAEEIPGMGQDSGADAQTASAGSSARIKRIGNRRREAAADQEQETVPELSAKNGEPDETDPAASQPEQTKEQEEPREETSAEQAPEKLPDSGSGPSRNEISRRLPDGTERERRVPERQEERGRYFEHEAEPAGNGFLRAAAWMLPFACGAAGGALGFYAGGSPVCAGICAACGLVIGLAGTACVLAVDKCTEQIRELAETVRNPGTRGRR